MDTGVGPSLSSVRQCGVVLAGQAKWISNSGCSTGASGDDVRACRAGCAPAPRTARRAPPRAYAVNGRPYWAGPRCSAYSTKMPNTASVSSLLTATAPTSAHSNGRRNRNRSPSAIRTQCGGGRLRFQRRQRPAAAAPQRRRRPRRPGTARRAANSNPPTGGPTNWMATLPTTGRRLFARSRSVTSTRAGNSACAAESANVSAAVSPNATTHSAGMSAKPTATSAVSTPGQGGTHQVGDHVDGAPIPSVHQRTCQQADQQPRQRLGDRDRGHVKGIAGDHRREQGQRGLPDSVAGAGDPDRRQQPSERPTQPCAHAA
jgi:hypothetical protein